MCLALCAWHPALAGSLASPPAPPPRITFAETILIPDADTWVDGDLGNNRTNWNFGASETMHIYGWITPASAIRSNAISDMLLHFDLSTIPSGSTITNASLRLFWLNNGQGVNTNWDTTFYVLGALRPWKEGTGAQGDLGFRTGATFNWTDGSNSWAGGNINGSSGNYDLTPTATKFRSGSVYWANTYVPFDITALVNAWQTGARTNYGLVVTCKGTASRWPEYNVASREGAFPPELLIQYQPPDPPLPPGLMLRLR